MQRCVGKFAGRMRDESEDFMMLSLGEETLRKSIFINMESVMEK